MENKLLVNVYVLSMEKSFFFSVTEKDYKKDDLIVVETTRGLELGKVVSEPIEKEVLEEDEYPKVIKRGGIEDYQAHMLNIEKSKEAIKITQEEADKQGLDMKIVSADYTLDGTKIMICYLSETRVDFRELLKTLAAALKCRIELKQIGTRDKAKMIGGLGICGLKLCCSTFLNEFDGISITMAKNQMLALNIPKLSGHCGKLICCLKYENDVYTELQKELPRIGTRVRYENEIYKITSMNVITKMIRIENKDNINTVPYDTIKDSLLPRDYPMNQPLPPQPKVEEKQIEKETPKVPEQKTQNQNPQKPPFNKNRNNGNNQRNNNPSQNQNNQGNNKNNQQRNNSFQKHNFQNRQHSFNNNSPQRNNNQHIDRKKNDNDAKN